MSMRSSAAHSSQAAVATGSETADRFSIAHGVHFTRGEMFVSCLPQRFLVSLWSFGFTLPQSLPLHSQSITNLETWCHQHRTRQNWRHSVSFADRSEERRVGNECTVRSTQQEESR